jgi:hypothetical protein
MASGFSHLDPSPEFLAVSTNVYDLCSGITNISTVPAFALSLEQRGLITSSASSSILSTNGISEEEKCGRLLKAVQEQLRVDPTKFESFVGIFSSEPALALYAQCLSKSCELEVQKRRSGTCDPPSALSPGQPHGEISQPVIELGKLTQRDSSHPGHYRFRLLQLEQQGIISDVREEYKDNFICVLTFVHVSTRRKLPFQSEKVVGTKAEAKESAAKVAVLFLDEEVTRKQTPPKRQGTTPKLHCATGATGADTKDPITKLKEYCEKNKLSHNYKEVKCGGQQFQVRVIVQGKPYVGIPQSKKQDAKKTAAQKALNGLKL